MIVTALAANLPRYCGQRAVLIEQVFQRGSVGDLAAFQELGDRGVDPAVHRVGKMLRREELADPAIGRIVDQDRAEERLLGLGVGGRLRNALEIGLAQRGDPRCAFHARQDSTLASAHAAAIRSPACGTRG
jgi:hypothetical protein